MRLLISKLFTIANHYTSVNNLKDILSKGMLTGDTLNGNGHISQSYFLPENDYLQKDQIHLQNSIKNIKKRNKRLYRLEQRRARGENVFIPEHEMEVVTPGIFGYFKRKAKVPSNHAFIGEYGNERMPGHYRQLSLMDGPFGGVINREGKSELNNSRTSLIRLVCDIPDDIKDTSPYPLEFRTERYDVPPERIKVQIPFGAVTQENIRDYKILLDLPIEKFDLTDDYTRRIIKILKRKYNTTGISAKQIDEKFEQRVDEIADEQFRAREREGGRIAYIDGPLSDLKNGIKSFWSKHKKAIKIIATVGSLVGIGTLAYKYYKNREKERKGKKK